MLFKTKRTALVGRAKEYGQFKKYNYTLNKGKPHGDFKKTF